MVVDKGTPLRYAETVVSFVEKTRGIKLDYSVGSLQQVDAYVESLRATDTIESADQLLGALGCYVGEVFVRNASAEWHFPGGDEMVVRLPSGTVCTPISKTFKLFQNGLVDSLAFFYRAAPKGARS